MVDESSRSHGSGRQADGSSDRRWILLTENGEWTTIGRSRDPSDEDIGHAEAEFRSRGLAGWLAVMSGSQYASDMPTLLEVRPLAQPKRSFSEAADAFRCLVETERTRNR